MKLGLSEIIKLVSNKQALAEKIKEELPPLLNSLLDTIAAEGGAEPGTPSAVVFFSAETKHGIRRMARVHSIDQFGELGEELGCLDVQEALNAVPNETISKLLPF